MKKNKLSLQEWQEIGSKAKEVQKGLMDLVGKLKVLPKTYYSDKWFAAEKAFGNLRSHLDSLVCKELANEPDNVVTKIFYGDNNK